MILQGVDTVRSAVKVSYLNDVLTPVFLSLLQARCRGCLVRKELRSVQAEFEDVVRELEGSSDHVTWGGPFIPKPTFTDRENTFRYRQPKTRPHPEPFEALKEQPGQGEPPPLHSEVLVAERDDEAINSSQRDCSRTCTPPGGDREVAGADLSSMAVEMSYSSVLLKGHQTQPLLKDVAHTPEALRQHRKTLAMELLWIQQAIASRKKYLSLKQKMEVAQ
ncbi:hypothetical protein NFI96_020175 [Prochilodus magdalenae]|nr:hypothetical protein NFI96_020175 [Prochilodus magdalenae]